MLSEKILSEARWEHNLDRRRARVCRFSGVHLTKQQAADKEAKIRLAMLIKANQERDRQAIQSQRRPGLMDKVRSFFRPRAMVGA